MKIKFKDTLNQSKVNIEINIEVKIKNNIKSNQLIDALWPWAGTWKMWVYPENSRKNLIFEKKQDIWKIRGYPEIPENHDIREKWDIWKKSQVRGIFPENHDSRENGTFEKNRWYPEILENQDIQENPIFDKFAGAGKFPKIMISINPAKR